ncbi:MAG TPA: TIGR04086 family membrane protein [Candidatus Polarisedimenticolia bacterium]|nr:TIGR04086 family membrane protein [Candidatus Polarisedimenticolia bacterium]
MDRDNAREPVVDFPPASLKRVSWSAVFAGVVVALITQVTLNLLGLGIGAATVNPLSEESPGSGLTIGASIWLAVSTIAALFAGGWVAGRLAGVPRRTDSLLHGLVTWGVTTLATFWLLTTAVGSLISGTGALVGRGAELAGQAAAAAGPAAAEAQRGRPSQDQQGGGQGAVTTIRRRAEEMLRQTDHPRARPDSLHSQAKEAVQQAGTRAEDPRYSDQALEKVLNRIDESGTDGIHPSDRQDLVEILVARTGMSRQEADGRVAQWEQDNQRVMQDWEQAQARAEQQLREAGEAAAKGVAAASIAAFVMLLLGGAAGALGGWAATPKDIAYGVART